MATLKTKKNNNANLFPEWFVNCPTFLQDIFAACKSFESLQDFAKELTPSSDIKYIVFGVSFGYVNQGCESPYEVEVFHEASFENLKGTLQDSNWDRFWIYSLERQKFIKVKMVVEEVD